MLDPDDPTLDAIPVRDAMAAGPQSDRRSHQEGTPDSAPRVGGFKLIRRLGKGGMGIVYEAEQKHPQRLVALKIVRPSYVSPELLRRFEYESQVLARLQHIGIAQVYQAGSVKDARGRTMPYFAMELIKGETLSAHVQEKNLDSRQCLALLARICDAVHHAHQKGVIHRDLKPSNILVDQEGQPKILDFGVARATDGDVQQTTMRTEVGQLIGTVQYMSPEQAAGDPDDIDTRSDVYALGVIAYEMIAKQLPYNLSKMRLDEAVRIIREDDPVRLSSVSNSLRGDIEILVAKALEKDKNRRYQSAEAFASDIRRFLSDEPILARRASLATHIRKFTRRHRGVTIGALLSLGLLMAGGLSTFLALNRALTAESDLTVQLDKTERARAAEVEQRKKAEDALAIAESERQRADLARHRAEEAETETAQRAAEVEQIADFQASLLRRINLSKAGALLTANVRERLSLALEQSEASGAADNQAGALSQFDALWGKVNATDVARDLIDRMILTPSIAAIDRKFRDQPLIDAQLRQVLADRYRDLGLYATAIPLQETALETRRSLLGANHSATRVSNRRMGDLLTAAGRPSDAAPYYRAVLERRTPRRSSAVAQMLVANGQNSEAIEHVRSLLAQARASDRPERAATLHLIDQLASLLLAQGHLDEAEPLRREAVDVGKRILRDGNQTLPGYVCRLGALLRDQGHYADAEAHLLEALGEFRRIVGAEHPETLVATIELGLLRQAQSRHADVISLLAPIEKASQGAFPGSLAPRLASFLTCLGDSHAALGQYAVAEAMLVEAHQLLADAGSDARGCAESLADLYGAWHATDPSRGRDALATQWRAKLDVIEE